jgi:hypothetical protein
MPTLVGVDVEARILELVDRHRPELEQLVDIELDRALDAIVVERIAARNGPDDDDLHRLDPAPAKLCSRCHERPRVAGRTICARCKSRRDGQRQRERRAAAAPVEQEPARPLAP